MIYGLLVYLPTLAFIPQWTFLFAGLYYIYNNRKKISFQNIFNKKIDSNLFIILFVIALGFINKVIFFDKAQSMSDLIPYFVLSLLTYFIATDIKKKGIKLFIYLVSAECFVVFSEYFLGVNTFFHQLPNYKEISNEYGLMYYNTALGLSSSSSIIAYKILLAFILVDYIKLKQRLSIILKIIFAIALFISFNRSALIILLFYILLQEAKFFINAIYLAVTKWKLKFSQLFWLSFGTVIFISSLLFVIEYYDIIFLQLTRNHSAIELSGREEIWPAFINFIKQNFWFGNGSYKFYADYYSGPIHAHNSYLQLIANNGIFIFIVYLFLILKNIRTDNLIFVFTLLFYSMTQYGIFWGISLMDIILFVFLFNQNISRHSQVNFVFHSQKKNELSI